MDWTKTTARRDEKHLSWWFGASNIRCLTAPHIVLFGVIWKHCAGSWHVTVEYPNKAEGQPLANSRETSRCDILIITCITDILILSAAFTTELQPSTLNLKCLSFHNASTSSVCECICHYSHTFDQPYLVNLRYTLNFRGTGPPKAGWIREPVGHQNRLPKVLYVFEHEYIYIY